jgi:hypothetical protein
MVVILLLLLLLLTSPYRPLGQGSALTGSP